MTTQSLRLIIASLLAATPVLGSHAQGARQWPSAAALAARVDSVIQADILGQGMPSASVVVMRGEETLIARAWGLADVATGRKAEPSTRYQLGSVAKQFTAALVLKQVDRGRLSLADTIGRFIEGLRPEMKGITVEQLLSHTSGLRSDFRNIERKTEARSIDSLIAMAARDTPAAKPGTTFIYSNTGYMLLGLLVEKLYGKSYARALHDEIAAPLGLETLRYCEAGDASMAQGHMRQRQRPATALAPIHPTQLLGSGGICATAGDVAKWNRALHGGRVISATSYAAMTTPRGAAKTRNYGMGLFVRPAPWGSMAMVHDGDTEGYAVSNAWYPAESLSVVVLYNGVPRPARDVDGIITQLAFGLTPAPAPAPAGAATASPGTAPLAPPGASRFVGDYEFAGRVFTVSLDDGVLYLVPPIGMGSRQALGFKSGTTYGLGGVDAANTATFVVDAVDQVASVVMRSAGGGERILRKVK